MESPRIVITGASSFTALWIAEALKRAGFSVDGLCSRYEEHYADLQLARINRFRTFGTVHFGLNAGSDEVIHWVRKNKPTVWIHHHHFMQNFRSKEYNIRRAYSECVEPIPELVAELVDVKCRGIIFSGTSIEPGELKIENTSPTPYAQSKKQVWDALLSSVSEMDILLSKVVIPNPIGPLENGDRLIPRMIFKSFVKEKLDLISGNGLENISVFRLAEEYVRAVKSLLLNKSEYIRPEVEKFEIETWVKLVNDDLLVSELHIPKCLLNRPNSDGIKKNASVQFNSDFWKKYAEELKISNYISTYKLERITNE
jgi:UDP-glucose 4-epimerase